MELAELHVDTSRLRDYQQAAFNFACPKQACLLAAWMGLGKTCVAIHLVQQWQASPVLVLCPKSVMGVWRREFLKWGDGRCRILVLDGNGTAATKAKQAETHLAVNATHYRAVIVVNYETARMKAFADWTLKRQWGCVICDESHRIKSATSHVSKYADKLRPMARRRLALTGTPLPHSPLDAFAQARFLNPSVFGRSWHQFRNTYAKLKTIPGVPVPIVDGYQNLDLLQARLAEIAFFVDGSVLQLPEETHETIPCELSSRARSLYRQMEEDFIFAVRDGTVTAANALVRLLRLQQITSGTVPLDDSDKIERVDTSKQEALYDLIDALSPEEPVVVFGRFHADLDAAMVTAERLGRPYLELSGRRKELDQHGCMRDVPGQVLGVQIQAGGLGVDLTRARYAVYYSLGFSLGEYQQSVARLHRFGQTRPVFLYHLIATGTVDERVYKALAERQQVVESIVNAIKGC